MVGKIRCNSEGTRRRTAAYLVGRYFPGETLHRDLVEFAAKTAGKPALSDALFYLTCRMEPIVASVAEDVVFPSLPEGGVARSRILEFVQSRFPGSRSVSDMSQAIVSTYERFGIGSATRTRLNVSLREGSLAAFGYVLHLEFPEPGMYSFERLQSGPMHRWLLWDQQQFPACDFRPENTLVLISHFANSLCIMLSRIPYLTTWINGVARHGTCSR